MNVIIRYIIDMSPYMLLSIPIYLIVRFMIIRKRKIHWHHEIGLFIFTIFIVGLMSQTIIPKLEIGSDGNISVVQGGVHTTNLIPFKVLIETYREVFVNGNIHYFLINFLGNIIMFMPIGFFIPLLWKVSGRKVIVIGGCSSLLIEVCQLFLSRGTDIDDIILNTIGVALGLLVYKILYRVFSKHIIQYRG